MKLKFDKSQIDNIWLTSDTHFGHANIIKYCNRPFKDTKEMDETLIEKWNKEVPPGGIVFHLGDFAFSWRENESFAEEVKARLNGHIYLVWGNHDHRDDWRYSNGWISSHTADLIDLRVGNDSAVLCHYPLMVWKMAHHGAYHFFGHVHNNIPLHSLRPMSWDVGVDGNNFTPLSLRNAMSLAASHDGNNNTSYKKGFTLQL